MEADQTGVHDNRRNDGYHRIDSSWRGAELRGAQPAARLEHQPLPAGLSTLRANNRAAAPQRLKSLVRMNPFAPRNIGPNIKEGERRILSFYFFLAFPRRVFYFIR